MVPCLNVEIAVKALPRVMESLGARLAWSEFVETSIFNSNKVVAIYDAG